MILRRTDSGPNGTFGILDVDGQALFYTCEPPRIFIGQSGQIRYPYGQPFESCVPEGSYTLVWHRSQKYGMSWHLQGDGVWLVERDRATEAERYACLIHAANWPHQLAGCIALGMARRFVESRDGIERSRLAVQQFESLLSQNKQYELLII